MSLQLGWYRSKFPDEANGKLVQLLLFKEEVLNPVAIYECNARVYEMFPDEFRNWYEYIGAEEVEIWVPADPSKITLEMLPLTARFRNGREWKWSQGRLVGSQHNVDYRFLSNSFRYFKYCEILENKS